LALTLWEELRLDRFWAERLPANRKGARWDQELFVPVAYRLLARGSERRLHREWFERTALADLLGGDFGLAEIHKLYRCHAGPSPVFHGRLFRQPAPALPAHLGRREIIPRVSARP
jgi:hypothetical protein